MPQGKKFHINPETGKPNQCNATEKRGCKYKTEDGKEPPHYATKEEAQAAQNQKDADKYGTVASLSKNGAKKPKESMEEMHGRWTELRKQADEEKARYLQAKRMAHRLEKRSNILTDARSRITEHTERPEMARMVLGESALGREFIEVPDEQLAESLDKAMADTQENLRWATTARDNFKETLDGTRGRRNRLGAKMQRIRTAEMDKKKQAAREAAEQAEREKYALRPDPERADSKADPRVDSYTKKSTYRKSGYRGGGVGTSMSMRFPNPKDADPELVQRASEEAARFLEQNPYSQITLDDKYGHGGGVYTISHSPKDGSYSYNLYRYNVGHSIKASYDIREIVTYAANDSGFNNDEKRDIDA